VGVPVLGGKGGLDGGVLSPFSLSISSASFSYIHQLLLYHHSRSLSSSTSPCSALSFVVLFSLSFSLNFCSIEQLLELLSSPSLLAVDGETWSRVLKQECEEFDNINRVKERRRDDERCGEGDRKTRKAQTERL
jgi:hypothetical protein